MTWYYTLEIQKNSTRNLLEVMKKFSKVTGYKFKLHKSKAFLCTNNKQTNRKRDYGHTPIHNSFRRNKISKLNQRGKDLYNKHLKSLKKTEKGTRKWKDIPYFKTIMGTRKLAQ